MPSSLIRGKYVIARVTDRERAEVFEDGAVFQRDGVIVEVGPYADLAARHTPDRVLGSPDHLVLPGMVDGHHLGVTSFQRGLRDDALVLHVKRFCEGFLGTRARQPLCETSSRVWAVAEGTAREVQHACSHAGVNI